jgi:hypothetical protein
MSEFKTPQELLEAYNNGLPGHVDDPRATDDLLSSLPMPLFGDFSDDIKESGKGKLSLPFKSAVRFDAKFGEDERQTTGDCVSHGTRNAIDISRATDIAVKNEAESFIVRGATEGIYGARGHGRQGMSGAVAARWVHSTGGILLRKNYGSIDLSTYDSRKGIRWGTQGIPRELIQIARQNPVETISLIKTLEEARDALANGYGIAICSNYGFESTRDKNGMSRRRGNWNHCMCVSGCDDTRDIINEMIFLIQNSWGRFNGGGKIHGQPDGSFWISSEDMAGMLRQNGAWVFSNVKGFPPRKVNWTLNEVY